MRVIESQLNAQAAHQASQKRTVRESLRSWVGDRRPDFERPPGNAGVGATQVQISAPARAIQAAETRADQSATAINKANEEIANDPKLQLLKAMIERLTGQKIKLLSNEEFTVKTEQITNDTTSPQRRAGFARREGKPLASRSRRAFASLGDRHVERVPLEMRPGRGATRVDSVPGWPRDH